MNWEVLGSIGEFVGAIAVVTTLLFLIHQIRQTSAGQSAAAYTNWAQMRIELSNAWSQRDVARTIINGLYDPASLTDEEERLVFHNHMHQFMIVWEVTWQLWQKGLLSEEDWDAGAQMISEVKSAPTFVLWWPSVSDHYHANFVEQVNRAPVVPTGYANFVEKLESTRPESAK